MSGASSGAANLQGNSESSSMTGPPLHESPKPPESPPGDNEPRGARVLSSGQGAQVCICRTPAQANGQTVHAGAADDCQESAAPAQAPREHLVRARRKFPMPQHLVIRPRRRVLARVRRAPTLQRRSAETSQMSVHALMLLRNCLNRSIKHSERARSGLS
eukprot:8873151-Pyramimonas_sp.AAC.1